VSTAGEPVVPDGPRQDLLDTPAAGPAAIRGSLLRVTGYGVGMLMSVVSVSLLIRHLGIGDFGRYVTIVSLVTVVQGVTDAGLLQVGVREYAVRQHADRDAMMRNLVGVRLVLTVAGVALATLFAAVAGYGSTLITGTILAGVGLVLLVAQGTFAVSLQAQLRLGWVTAMDALRQVLSVAAIAALVAAGAGLTAFLAVPIPVGVVVLIATVRVVRGAMPVRPSFERSEWATLIRSVLPFAAAVAIGTVYLRITVILMSLLASATETGYYATSYRVLEVLVAVPPLVVGSTLPIIARAARDNRDRLHYVLQRLFEATLIVGVALGLFLAIAAPFIVEVLSGHASSPSVPVLRIQALAITATFVASSWQYGLLSLYRHRALLVLSVMALTLSVALTLALVPQLEARGAAIAFTAGEVAVAVLAYLLLRRADPSLRVSLRIPVRVLVATALAGSAVFIPGLGSLVEAIVALTLFFVVLVALRGLPPELVDALRRRQP
jgi:O-antigen/teichoic acid export membrane protein